MATVPIVVKDACEPIDITLTTENPEQSNAILSIAWADNGDVRSRSRELKPGRRPDHGLDLNEIAPVEKDLTGMDWQAQKPEPQCNAQQVRQKSTLVFESWCLIEIIDLKVPLRLCLPILH